VTRGFPARKVGYHFVDEEFSLWVVGFCAVDGALVGDRSDGD